MAAPVLSNQDYDWSLWSARGCPIVFHLTDLTSFRRGGKYYYMNYSPEGENAAASVK